MSLLENILTTHGRVMPYLSKHDKRPNIDGELELLDSQDSSAGKVEAQVKTLRGHCLKYACPVRFINYCRGAQLPVLLFCADNTSERIYWLHLSTKLIDQLHCCHIRSKKTITLDAEQYLARDRKDYIEKWLSIVRGHQLKVLRYDSLRVKNERQGRLLEELRKRTNPVVGLTRPEFRGIHCFLDELNQLLDHEFGIVKRRYYPDAWKLGLAFADYSDTCVSYALYPIFPDCNDVQIKQVIGSLKDYLDGGLDIHWHLQSNPVSSEPRSHAISSVHQEVNKLFKDRLLDHRGSAFLARECIFAFVGRYHSKLGLELKNTYSLTEIEMADFQFRPSWVIAAAEHIAACAVGMTLKQALKDPSCALAVSISKDVIRNVGGRLELNLSGLVPPRAPDDADESSGIPFRIFLECMGYLRSQGTESIARVYAPSVEPGQRPYAWQRILAPEVLEVNLRTFFENLPSVFESVIAQNFPLLGDKLRLFHGANRVIVVFDARTAAPALAVHRRFLVLSFINETASDEPIKVEVRPSREYSDLEGFARESQSQYMDFEGVKHQLSEFMVTNLHELLGDTPMLSYVYAGLKEAIRVHLDVLRREM